MQADPLTIYVLHSESVAAQLRNALHRRCNVQTVANWNSLIAALHSAPNCVAVIDPYFGSGRDQGMPNVGLENLIATYPSTPIVAALRVNPSLAQDVRHLIGGGVAEIIDLGVRLDDPVALGVLLERARGYRMRVVLAKATPRFLSTRARAVLTAVGETVATGGLAPQVAERLGVTERTLLRWCLRLDLGQPRRLLAWLRLLLAAEMLCESDRSVATVARACGYSSDPSLRNALKCIGCTTPGEIKRLGSTGTIFVRFADELARRRGQTEPRKPEYYLN